MNDIKLSDITEHLKREIDNATKKSNEQMGHMYESLSGEHIGTYADSGTVVK